MTENGFYQQVHNNW